jgi:hypothetical protein
VRRPMTGTIVGLSMSVAAPLVAALVRVTA